MPPLSFDDQQLDQVMAACAPERRAAFLEAI